MALTSIVIPTYNALHLLTGCIQAIRTHTHVPYELIIVDNGSTDGTAEWCAREDVHVIGLASNEGFPKACNIGLREARGDTLLLLNNDVIVTHNWLPNMLACLNSASSVGIVGPVSNYASGRQKRKADYRTIDQFHLRALRHNRHNPRRWRRVRRIVGLCFLFRRDLMERIGELDESFSPGYYEDDDYCFRARRAGYRLMLAGDVMVHHYGSVSFRKEYRLSRMRLLAANRRKFIHKWGVDPRRFV
ncbi:glycosyltransferase family 2 protein [Paenibacillus contaminans]|uniref:Glycosyltransferase family 2 protein n=1 Tax=Paenibacillus contaminans TaxID=450362 RepID=A0A329MRA2_9BACL|nr:glycosyltransferase family 2 protein [Paenibacillus contaminans]RAV22082.1 glycosyltransferase family 2 protein [Paenibacillus contaminans]